MPPTNNTTNIEKSAAGELSSWQAFLRHAPAEDAVLEWLDVDHKILVGFDTEGCVIPNGFSSTPPFLPRTAKEEV